MTKKRGDTTGNHTHAKNGAQRSTGMNGITIVSLSVSKTDAKKIGRVKRWEDRSESASLTLTGRH